MGSAALEPQRGVQEGTGREPQEGLQEGGARREPQMDVQEGSGASGGCAGGWGQGAGGDQDKEMIQCYKKRIVIDSDILILETEN